MMELPPGNEAQKRSSVRMMKGQLPSTDQLLAALDTEHGFETDVGHLTVFGRCANCRRPAGTA